MADLKVSDLGAIAVVGGTDLFHIVQGATVNKKMTGANAKTQLGAPDVANTWTVQQTFNIAPIAPVGRGATIIVAASDSPTTSKNQADYVCDGTADNVEIQAALDALTGGRTWQEKVILMGGTYHIAATVEVAAYTILENQGLVILDNAVNADLLTNAAAGNGYIEITGGIWDGNRVNQAALSTVIHFNDVYNTWVHHTNVRHGYTGGIDVNGGSVVMTRRLNTISDNFVLNCGSPLRSSFGIATGGDYGQLCVNNAVWTDDNDGNRGIQVMGHMAMVSGNSVHRYVIGIYVVAQSEHMILNNTILTCSGQAIWLNQTTNAAVSGNTISACGIGILSTDGQYNLITNNIVRDNTTNIQLDGNCDYTLIQGNNITSDLGVGRLWGVKIVDATCNENKIAYNTFRPGGFVTAIIADSGTDTIIEHNTGFVSESFGTATVANGDTDVTVAHGLDVTPTLGNISVTPTNSLGNATKFYISNVGAANFDINVDIDPGVTTATFAWSIGAYGLGV